MSTRRFDDLITTVANLRRQVRDLEAKSLRRIGFHDHDGAYLQPVTATDTLTWHEDSLVVVTASTYHPIFDIAAATELLGGSIDGANVGFRLTIDGTVVADRTAVIRGNDFAGNSFNTVALPPARAESSMKLEAYNTHATTDRTMGWRIATR